MQIANCKLKNSGTRSRADGPRLDVLGSSFRAIGSVRFVPCAEFRSTTPHVCPKWNEIQRCFADRRGERPGANWSCGGRVGANFVPLGLGAGQFGARANGSWSTARNPTQNAQQRNFCCAVRLQPKSMRRNEFGEKLRGNSVPRKTKKLRGWAAQLRRVHEIAAVEMHHALRRCIASARGGLMPLRRRQTFTTGWKSAAGFT